MKKNLKIIFMVLCLISVFSSFGYLKEITYNIKSEYFAITATVTTTNSVCPKTGTATIVATGGTGTYTYHLRTFPTGFDASSIALNGNTLSGLEIGNYSVEIIDTNGERSTINFRIGGNAYRLMEPTYTAKRLCTNIRIDAQTSYGIPPYKYSILSGPGITQETALQDENYFIVDTPGNYMIRVYDSCNQIQTRTVNANITIVPTNLVYNPILNNDFLRLRCEDGMLKYNANFNYPRDISTSNNYPEWVYPINYVIQLDNGHAPITGTMIGDRFIYEDVLNYIPNQTYNYTITFTNNCGESKSFTGIISAKINISVTDVCLDPTLSTNFKIYNSNTVYQVIDNLGNVVTENNTGIFKYSEHPNMQFGSSYKIKIISDCNYTFETETTVFVSSIATIEGNNQCLKNYRLCTSSFLDNTLFDFLLYKLTDLNTPIVTKLAGQDDGIFYKSDSPLIIENEQYRIVMRNRITGINVPGSNSFRWTASTFTQQITQSNVYGSWPEGIIGTAHISIHYTKSTTNNRPVNIVITEGPSSFTKYDGTVVNLSYPIRFDNVAMASTYTYNVRASLPIGVYKVKIEENNECYNDYEQTIEVTYDQAQHKAVFENLNIEYVTYCGDNRSSAIISWDAIKSATHPNINKHRYSKMYYKNINTGIYTFSSVSNIGENYGPSSYQFNNIQPGTYEIGFYYSDASNKRAYGTPLNTLTFVDEDVLDTVTFTGYKQSEIENVIVSECTNGSRNIAVMVKDGTGLPPYMYSILNGPNGYTAAEQSSNVFENLQPGIYEFGVEDSCRNRITTTLEISNFTPPPYEIVGKTCIGDDAKFSFPDLPYYQYVWTLPNGQTHIGNELVIDNLNASHFGTYKVEFIVTVGGCTTNAEKSYTLSPCEGLKPLVKPVYLNPNLRMRTIK